MAWNWGKSIVGGIKGGIAGAPLGPYGAVTGAIIGGVSGGREKKEKKGSSKYSSDAEGIQNVSTLSPRQQTLQRNATRAATHRGAPGVIGQAADKYRALNKSEAAEAYRGMNKSEAANLYRDMPQNEAAEYYRGNLSNDPADFDAFARPEMRNFSENIAPGIAEQYAGMGAGGANGGFANSLGQSAVDLSERLGAIRANLRQNSAQGLQNMYMQSAQGLHGINSERAQGLHGINMQKAQGLQSIHTNAMGNNSENVRNTPQPGFGQNIAEGIGQAIPSLVNYGISKIGGGSPGGSPGGKTGPYGSQSWGSNNLSASPKISWQG